MDERDREYIQSIISLCVLAAPFESSCFTGTGAAEGAQIIEDLKRDIAAENPGYLGLPCG